MALDKRTGREIWRSLSNPGNRRERGAVNWSHPAYANRRVVARNDDEIVSLSLEKASPSGDGGRAR